MLRAEMASTEYSLLSIVPGLALATTRQECPFQCSTSADVVALLVSTSPTAHTLDAETAVRPSSSLLPATNGALTVRQARPFQCSISAWPVPSPDTVPTA